jgi:hypothetical protein
MSVWPLQALNFRIAGSQVEAVRLSQRAPLRPPFWLLLAGIIVIGIGIGLFTTSVTVILLSSPRGAGRRPGRRLGAVAPADTVDERGWPSSPRNH